MTSQRTFPQNIAHLEARVGVFNDHLKASAKETGAQLHARADQIRADITTGTDELGSEMKETTAWFAQRASTLKTAVSADIDAARTKRSDARESDRTTREAEVAEAYASATHTHAMAAIAESEQAAMEALAARAAATDLKAGAPG